MTARQESEASRQKRKERDKRYYAVNREKRVQQARVRRKSNPEKVRELSRSQWKRRGEENPVLRMYQSAKHRATALGVPFNLRLEDITVPKCCPVLGIPLVFSRGKTGGTPNSPSIDRIHADRGYVRGNIVIVSWRANSLKSNATADEIRALAAFYCDLMDVL